MLVSVSDIRLFVDVEGAKFVPDGDSMRERPTIVMLHGNGADHSPFKEFYVFLRESSPRSSTTTIAGTAEVRTVNKTAGTWVQWADDLVALCDTWGSTRPVVFGFSFGGDDRP